MMTDIVPAIMKLQDVNANLDVSKSTHMGFLRILFKRQLGAYEPHDGDDTENLLKMIVEHKEHVIRDLNEFVEVTEHLVDELNKEKGDDL